MVREFKLPDVGEGLAEAEIVRWLVEPGDAVSEDQPVAEVETDKAVVEVPAPVNGTVKEILAEEPEVEGFDPVVGEMRLTGSSRALTLGIDEGFVRIIADAETEFVLGGQIVGAEASELIAETGLAIEMGARLEDVAAVIHTHPTLSEAVGEVTANARGEVIHTLNQ